MRPTRQREAANTASVIGADLVIKGTLDCKGEVQVDGQVEGDIHAQRIVVGERAQTTGNLVAESVEISGNVAGSIASQVSGGVPGAMRAASGPRTKRFPPTAIASWSSSPAPESTSRWRSVSVGMTLQELADYILSLGATDAMNLDGGGSTTMFLDGNVVNTPSDKEGERKVSDAILVTLRKNK